MKILVAVDGSPHTERMLSFLGRHPEWFGAGHAYTVLHCVPAVPPGAANLLSAEDLDTYYRDEGEKVLAPVRGFFERQKIAAEYSTHTGPAADNIASLADKGGYDLVMMGSHGHGTLGSLVLGSVATKVMSNCGTPVLLVR